MLSGRRHHGGQTRPKVILSEAKDLGNHRDSCRCGRPLPQYPHVRDRGESGTTPHAPHFAPQHGDWIKTCWRSSEPFRSLVLTPCRSRSKWTSRPPDCRRPCWSVCRRRPSRKARIGSNGRSSIPVFSVRKTAWSSTSPRPVPASEGCKGLIYPVIGTISSQLATLELGMRFEAVEAEEDVDHAHIPEHPFLIVG